ncbi:MULTISPECIES: NAD-dependent epimerase/dehydratase family protein [unclassified Phyllobacterium]|uniref:NAD-dependent epimerase/dehydratase family protein n=1 Tax=unclassified Phyllobacterium TaxID=2638441 RepID=UPI000E0EDCCC
MKFLVTGANGYVGRYVTKALVRRGEEVVAAIRSRTDGLEGATIYSGDILQSTSDIFDETGRPDVVIHLAWEDGFIHQSPKHLENLTAHTSFIENMLKGGLKQILSVGTSHEIGFHTGPVDENTPTRPLHPYGVAKNHLRQVQSLLCQQYQAVDQWARCFYIWGDDARNNSIFTKLLKAEEEGKAEFPLNSGELLYDFVHVAELGEMIADAASQKDVTGIINCCSGDPVSLKTMVLNFIETHGLKIKPVWGAFPLRPYDSRAIWGDNKKIILSRKSLETLKVAA